MAANEEVTRGVSVPLSILGDDDQFLDDIDPADVELSHREKLQALAIDQGIPVTLSYRDKVRVLQFGNQAHGAGGRFSSTDDLVTQVAQEAETAYGKKFAPDLDRASAIYGKMLDVHARLEKDGLHREAGQVVSDLGYIDDELMNARFAIREGRDINDVEQHITDAVRAADILEAMYLKPLIKNRSALRAELLMLGNPYKGRGGRFVSKDEEGNPIGESKSDLPHEKGYTRQQGADGKWRYQRIGGGTPAPTTAAPKEKPAAKPAGGGPAPSPQRTSSSRADVPQATIEKGRGLLVGEPVTATNDESHGGGMSESRLVTIGGKDGLFKPEDGERWNGLKRRPGPVRASLDANEGSQALREVLSHKVDVALGGTVLTPNTRMVTLNGQNGSVQEYAHGTSKFIKGEGTKPEDWQKMAVYDLLTGNTDRKGPNLLVKPDGGLVAIDHGLSFPKDNSEFSMNRLWREPKFRKMIPDDAKQSAKLKKAIEGADWGKILKPLGPTARTAFNERKAEVLHALAHNQVRALLTKRMGGG